MYLCVKESNLCKSTLPLYSFILVHKNTVVLENICLKMAFPPPLYSARCDDFTGQNSFTFISFTTGPMQLDCAVHILFLGHHAENQ